MSVYIGVDLGGTNMRAGRVENDCLVAQASERTPKSPKDTAETIDLLERVIRSVWTPEVSAIRDADRIIVLCDGKIAGMGTHEELMKNCEVYQQIALSQLSKEELS